MRLRNYIHYPKYEVIKLNKKGFTLIELLAVIVILAILLAIAIPRVTKYISDSRKDSMVTTAKEFADTVEKDATSEKYELPISNSDVTIVSLDLMQLQKGGTKSPFNAKWTIDSSYVAIINVGTDINPIYRYFVTLTDSKRYTIPLTYSESVSSSLVIRNDASKTKATITPICGDEAGKYMILDNIAGLEDYRPAGGWNVTAYSGDEC